MPSALNAEFQAKPDGLVGFLTNYPLDIEAGQFAEAGVTGEILVGSDKVVEDRHVGDALKISTVTKTKGPLRGYPVMN